MPASPPTRSPRLLTRFGDHFYAVDKPAGWLTHTVGTDAPDLVRWVRSQGGLPRDLRPVHRLDGPTSGVVLCATRAGRAAATAWFGERRVRKTYLALVVGRVRSHGEIERPLRENGTERAAHTRWRLREGLGGFALLEVMPVTGRKHQVRRHLASIGHPIVGDLRHKGKFRPVPAFPGRLWLHASRLRVPFGEEERVIESPLPPELEATLTALRESLR